MGQLFVKYNFLGPKVEPNGYSIRLLNKSYLERYDLLTFSLYYNRKGSAVEHVRKFIDTLRPYVGDEDLCLREFSKSLTNRAYT